MSGGNRAHRQFKEQRDLGIKDLEMSFEVDPSFVVAGKIWVAQIGTGDCGDIHTCGHYSPEEIDSLIARLQAVRNLVDSEEAPQAPAEPEEGPTEREDNRVEVVETGDRFFPIGLRFEDIAGPGYETDLSKYEAIGLGMELIRLGQAA